MTTRREAMMAMAALVALPACGGGTTGTDAGTTGGSDTGGGGGTCGANIGSNHGHALNVTRADVDAATEQTYDIQGTSAHAHTVTVSAADFGVIAASGSVIVTSSTGSGHSHMVTITCT